MRSLSGFRALYALSEGGKVVIESKWGCLGCYLHPPEGQRYSTSWRYYRSPRKGHFLTPFPLPTPHHHPDDPAHGHGHAHVR